ncbi:hypothetical protein ES703_122161 [subsurface metagenome]
MDPVEIPVFYLLSMMKDKLAEEKEVVEDVVDPPFWILRASRLFTD